MSVYSKMRRLDIEFEGKLIGPNPFDHVTSWGQPAGSSQLDWELQSAISEPTRGAVADIRLMTEEAVRGDVTDLCDFDRPARRHRARPATEREI